MTHSISRRFALTCGAGVLLLLTAGVHAQPFPSKPITLIVPWPAGGSTDRHFRALAEIAGKHLGQTIVIENKPGGGGTLGPGTMALTAKPDGYTIAQYPLGMLRYPHMQKVKWNPLNDFTFIIGVSGYTFGFVVKADSPYKTFNEYIEAARKQPGKIDYGSTGIGTSPHLLMEELAGCGEGRAEPRAVQRQRRPDAGAARRPRDGAERRHRLGQIRRRRPDAAAGDLRREAHQALAERAHRQGAGLRRGLDVAVRPGRTEGHGPGRREDAARRVQEGDGRPEARRAAAAAEPGLSGIAAATITASGRAETFVKDKALIERLGLATK